MGLHIEQQFEDTNSDSNSSNDDPEEAVYEEFDKESIGHPSKEPIHQALKYLKEGVKTDEGDLWLCKNFTNLCHLLNEERTDLNETVLSINIFHGARKLSLHLCELQEELASQTKTRDSLLLTYETYSNNDALNELAEVTKKTIDELESNISGLTSEVARLERQLEEKKNEVSAVHVVSIANDT